MKIKSTLTNITKEVYSTSNPILAKEIITNYLLNTRVKDRDKMIGEVKKLNSINQIYFYFTNSLLKFEGLGVK